MGIGSDGGQVSSRQVLHTLVLKADYTGGTALQDPCVESTWTIRHPWSGILTRIFIPGSKSTSTASWNITEMCHRASRQQGPDWTCKPGHCSLTRVFLLMQECVKLSHAKREVSSWSWCVDTTSPPPPDKRTEKIGCWTSHKHCLTFSWPLHYPFCTRRQSPKGPKLQSNKSV